MKKFLLSICCSTIAASSYGQFQTKWIRVLGGDGDDIGVKAIVLPNDSIALIGTTQSPSLPGHNGQEDVVYVPLSAAGSGGTSYCYGGSANDRANDVVQLANGNLMVVGVSVSNNGN